MKYDRSNTALRYALWTAYGRKCQYTHEPIKYHEMEIDHFIPQEMAKKPKELQLLLKEANIDENFDIFNLENCLPAKKPINNSKSNIPFNSHNTRYYINYIKQHLEKVMLIYREFMNCDKNAKAMAQLNAAIKKGNEELEEIINSVTGENPEFEVRDEESDFDTKDSMINYHVVNKNYERVGISINLPSKKDAHGNCLIYFKSLAVRECFITFNHYDILSILFEGIYSDYSKCIRGFIDHKIADKNIYCIQFRQLRFYLNSADTSQLCRLVDEIYPRYIKKLRELDEFHGISKFHLSKNKRARLFRMKKWLYKAILEFGGRHDYLSGDSEWHIFNSSSYNIMIMNKSNEYGSSDFHTYLYPGRVDSLLDPLNESDEVWVEWPIDNRELLKMKYEYSQDGYWDATYVYEWLTSKVIPKIVYDNSRVTKGAIFKRLISYTEFLASFRIEDYIYSSHIGTIELDYNWSLSELYDFIEKLQLHYSITRFAWFSNNSLRKLYATLAKVVKNSGKPLSGYAIGHLSYIDDIDKDSSKAILEYSNCLNNDGIETGRLEVLFRSYLDVLRSSRNMDSDLILEVKESLIPFIEVYNNNLLIKKYLGE